MIVDGSRVRSGIVFRFGGGAVGESENSGDGRFVSLLELGVAQLSGLGTEAARGLHPYWGQ